MFQPCDCDCDGRRGTLAVHLCVVGGIIAKSKIKRAVEQMLLGAV